MVRTSHFAAPGRLCLWFRRPTLAEIQFLARGFLEPQANPLPVDSLGPVVQHLLHRQLAQRPGVAPNTKLPALPCPAMPAQAGTQTGSPDGASILALKDSLEVGAHLGPHVAPGRAAVFEELSSLRMAQVLLPLVARDGGVHAHRALVPDQRRDVVLGCRPWEDSELVAYDSAQQIAGYTRVERAVALAYQKLTAGRLDLAIMETP